MKTARAGFTLLEVLLAMGLVSLLAGTLYASLHVAFRARDSIQRAADQGSAGQLALDMMRRDLTEALPSNGILAGIFTGTDAQGQSGADADDISFYAAAHTGTSDLPEGDVCLIDYTIGNDEDGQPALVRNTTTNLLATDTQDPTTEVICRKVQALNLRYFDGSTWADSWDSAQQNNAPPVAVEVTLTLKSDATTAQAPAATGTSAQNSGNVLTRVVLLPCAPAPQGNLINLPSSGRTQ
jgi:type II secretion system protein J